MSRQTNLNQSVVFLDAGVTDYQSLQAGVIPGVATVILSAKEDGIEQITAFLQQNPQITTIHLVCHGAPGCLYLGNCQLNLTNIYDYRQQLQNWAKINRILLYGCQVAAGDTGTEFIEKLHQLTGATVMASATPTGSSRGGGDWDLEVIVSRAESEQDLNISLAFVGGTLATYEGVFTLSLVGNYDTPGDAYGVYVVGNYAYVADFSLGLQIIDISTPTNPTLISNYDTSGFAVDVQVIGNYAYLADDYQGLKIIDISNPTNPTLTGNYSDWPLGWAYGLEVVGNYAYVASDYQGLTIIDISNPSNPTLIGNYDTSSRALKVQVIGNYAYLADGESGLQIIDISNPENPTLKGNYDTPGIASDVEVVGNYAYLADGWDGGLQIIDISNPTNPIFIGNYDTNGVANDVEVVGNYAYLADDMAGLKIIDISNPTNPTLIDYYNDFSTVAYGVEVVGNYAYLADYFDGLKIIDVSNFNNPSPLPSVTLAVSSTSVTEDGTTNLVYTFTRTGDTTNLLTVNFTTVDDTDWWKTAIFNTDYSQTGAASFPSFPSETGTVTFAANSATATVTIDPTADTTVEDDETVSLTLTSGTDYTVGTTTPVTGMILNDDTSVTLQVVPSLVTEDGTSNLVYYFYRDGVTTNALTVNYTVGGTATFNTDYTQTGAASFTSTTGTVTFAANATTATVTIDPTVDNIADPDETVTLTLATGTGYTVGTTTTVTGTINDDINPPIPTFISKYDTPGWVWGLKVVGNYAYLADWTSGLQIIDISNPTNPTFKGNYDTDAAYGVEVVGNYAYIADGSSGLQIIDISNPTNPTFIGNYDNFGAVLGVQVVGNYAYLVNNGASSLEIIDISNPTNPTLKGSYDDDSDPAFGLQVVGNYAYVADGESGLKIIDISNPTNPILKGSYDTSYAFDVEIVGDYAYVADYDSGLQIIDISNPDTPTLVGNYDYDTDGYDLGVQIVGNYAYVADGSGLKIIDISNPAAPTLVDNYITSGTASDVEIVGNYAYVAAREGGLQIIDVSDFNNPSPLPSVTLAVSTTSVTEDGTTNLVYTFTRTGDITNPLTVNYTVGGTATNGTDYTSIPTSVTFAANSATATVTVDPTADTTVEPDETVTFTLAAGTGYTVGTTIPVTGTITNDDVTPSITLAVSPTSVTEDGTTNLVYTFTRSGSTTNSLTVNYTLGGTATLNTDYTRTGTNNTVTFSANSTTATVTVDPTADTTVESNETVALTLATGTGYTVGTTTAVTGTITNDDVTLPSITLAVSPSSVTEDGTANLVYTFTRSGVTTNALTVNYTVGGTATNGTDYTSIPTSVTFAANSATAKVTIDPTADTTVEPDETVILTLATGTGYTVGTPNAATGTITNDDISVTPIEAFGNTKLVKDTTNKLYTQIGDNNPTAIKNGGTQITTNIYSGWQTLAAETVNGVNQVLWKYNDGNYLHLWSLDNNWNWQSSTGWWGLNSSEAFTQETNFQQDFNGDGVIGQPFTPIEAFGNTKLVKDATNKLYAQIGDNNPTAIKNGGTQITTNIYSGWQTLAAETVNGVNQVLWKYNDGNYLHLWSLDNNWNWQSSTGWWGLNSSEAFTQETNFQQDFNSDGVIGQPFTPIEAFGNTKLVKDATNKLYAQIGNNNPIAIKNGGTQITTNIYPGWQTLAAETVNGVNQVLWKYNDGNYLHLWSLDNNWNWQSSTGWWGLNSSEAFTQETNFQQDFNGDNKIGNPLPIIGSSNDDIITGTLNNDILVGGLGNDTITGGAGSDRFTFNNRNEGIDTITDFLSSQGDKIALSAAGFGGGLAAGVAITAAQFVLGTTALNASNRLIYNTITGGLFFDGDGTGTLAAIQIATLSSKPTLTVSDILVLV